MMHGHQIRKTVTVAVLTAFVTLALTAAGSSQAAIIRLKSRAIVVASVVTLADVADIFDRNPETVRELQAVTLLPAPASGSQLQLDFATIRSRLQTKGFNLTGIEFTGRSVVVVSVPASRTMSQPNAVFARTPKVTDRQVDRAEKLLSAVIRNYLRTAELGDINVDVQLDRSVVLRVLSGQATGYEVRGGRPPWDAWQLLTVRFIDGDERLQTVPVYCRVVAHPYVAMVKYTVPRGHVIRREDIVMQQIDTPNVPFPSLNEVLGRETTKVVRQGVAIKADDIRQVPLIRRNDIVTASARIGGITVKRQLKARGDGALGDRIQLVSLDGRQQIEATVVGYHEADVVGTARAVSEHRPLSKKLVQLQPSNRPGRFPTLTTDITPRSYWPVRSAGNTPTDARGTRQFANRVLSNRPTSLARPNSGGQ
jgi:flagella basal body P-ring formation protein FlgA